MYKTAKELKTNIRNVSAYLKQALAIKFDGIITNKKHVKPADLDSFMESQGYLIVGESKNCNANGADALNTHIPTGQKISFANMQKYHKAFCWYQFGKDNDVKAVRLENNYFTYERHNQSYHEGDCATTNAYIVVSLYHQLALTYSYHYPYNRTTPNVTQGASRAMAECFGHLVDCAIYAHHTGAEALVIPLTKGELKRSTDNKRCDHGFYKAAQDMIKLMGDSTTRDHGTSLLGPRG